MMVYSVPPTPSQPRIEITELGKKGKGVKRHNLVINKQARDGQRSTGNAVRNILIPVCGARRGLGLPGGRPVKPTAV